MDLAKKYQDWRKTINGSIFGIVFGLIVVYLLALVAIETGSLLAYLVAFFFIFDSIASAVNLANALRPSKQSSTKVKTKQTKAISTRKKSTKKVTDKKTNAKKRKPNKKKTS